jgi:hypothetical protein
LTWTTLLHKRASETVLNSANLKDVKHDDILLTYYLVGGHDIEALDNGDREFIQPPHPAPSKEKKEHSFTNENSSDHTSNLNNVLCSELTDLQQSTAMSILPFRPDQEIPIQGEDNNIIFVIYFTSRYRSKSNKGLLNIDPLSVIQDWANYFLSLIEINSSEKNNEQSKECKSIIFPTRPFAMNCAETTLFD